MHSLMNILGNLLFIRCYPAGYCSLVISREVFIVSEGHRNTRHILREFMRLRINSDASRSVLLTTE